METQFIPAATLLASPAASVPTSIPVIVKALLSSPLLAQCSTEVAGVTVARSEDPEHRPNAAPSSRQKKVVTLASTTHTFKSKCEYRIL
jgi:hypothetical protein